MTREDLLLMLGPAWVETYIDQPLARVTEHQLCEIQLDTATSNSSIQQLVAMLSTLDEPDMQEYP